VEFDLDDLMRMDTATLVKTEKESAGLKTINESRKRLNLGPVTGGNTVYLQHQDHSIEALAKRDAKADPFATGATVTSTNPALDPAEEPDETPKYLAALMSKALEEGLYDAA
jgi:phage portal protein BeeE